MPTYRASRDIQVIGLGRIRKGETFSVSEDVVVHRSAERVHGHAELAAAADALAALAQREQSEFKKATEKADAAKAKADKEVAEAESARQEADEADAKNGKHFKPKG